MRSVCKLGPNMAHPGSMHPAACLHAGGVPVPHWRSAHWTSLLKNESKVLDVVSLAERQNGFPGTGYESPVAI